MAGYTTSAPPQTIAQGIDNSLGAKLWTYQTADAIATVQGAGYFTNGGQLGMKVNDVVDITVTGDKVYSARVTVVSATAPGATTVSTAVAISA